MHRQILEKIRKQTTNKELENISVETEEGTVTLKDIFLNKLQSSISADVPEKLFQKYDVESMWSFKQRQHD